MHTHTRHQWPFFVIILVFYGRRCWETIKEKKIKKRVSMPPCLGRTRGIFSCWTQRLEDLFTVSVICSNCARHMFKQKFVWLEFGEIINVLLYFWFVPYLWDCPGVFSGLHSGAARTLSSMVNVRPKHGESGGSTETWVTAGTTAVFSHCRQNLLQCDCPGSQWRTDAS